MRGTDALGLAVIAPSTTATSSIRRSVVKASTLLPHLQKMLPEVVAGDPTATRVFLAESLKAEETGKGTSTKAMTETGVWSQRDLAAASADRGRDDTESFVGAATAFIERWKQLRPLGTK